MKRFYIENLGCAKNQVDAEVIISSLEQAGYVYGDSPDDADFIIVNTCGFIKPAKEESIQVTLDLRNRYPGRKIILAGCLAQRYGESMKELLPEVDGIFGNADPAGISTVLEGLVSGSGTVVMPQHSSPLPSRSRLLTFPGSAYLKIAEGCSNRCSYCAIPLIRGPVRSRSVEDVLDEFRQLIARGVREVNLIAQDVGSFGLDHGKNQLPELLKRLSGEDGDFWVRMLYIHPDRFPREILEIIRKDSRMLPYFDLPFQHASGRILKRMNRSGNKGVYLDLIASIRDALPEAVLRSTFLVGFPGENGTDFNELLEFQEEARIDWLGVFPYSREDDTPAYSMRGAVADRLAAPAARKRKQIVEERQIPITESALDRFVGSVFPVLIEESVEGEELFLARGYPHAPEVDGLVVVHGEDFAPGEVRQVKVIRRNGIDLEAVPAKEVSRA